MKGYSRVVDRALALASRAHVGQNRKGSDVPYFTHPVHVAMILLRHGASEPVVVAGLLHDIVEDTDIPLSRIALEFGDEVARLVEAVTVKESGASWHDVKQAVLNHLQTAPAEVLMLKGADTLHNMSALLLDVETQGMRAFDRFGKRPPQEVLWYYHGVAEQAARTLGPHPLCDELRETMAALKRSVDAA